MSFVHIILYIRKKGGEAYHRLQPVVENDEGVTQYRLLKSGIDNKTLDSLKKNKNITLLTLEKICRILNCTPNDVVKFKE